MGWNWKSFCCAKVCKHLSLVRYWLNSEQFITVKLYAQRTLTILCRESWTVSKMVYLMWYRVHRGCIVATKADACWFINWQLGHPMVFWPWSPWDHKVSHLSFYESASYVALRIWSFDSEEDSKGWGGHLRQVPCLYRKLYSHLAHISMATEGEEGETEKEGEDKSGQ